MRASESGLLNTEEPAGERGPVLPPVRRAELFPTLERRALPPECVIVVVLRAGLWTNRDRRADKNQALDSIREAGGQDGGGVRSIGTGNHGRSRDARGAHDCHRIRHVVVPAVTRGSRVLRPTPRGS